MYTPLIDLTISDPNTMITVMVEAKRFRNKIGQANKILTADQQLYKVLVDIKWDNPDQFRHCIARLGICICWWTLLGVLEVWSSTEEERNIEVFCRSGENVNRQKIPYEPEGIADVVEELLQNKVASFSQYSEHEMLLKTASGNSLTTKHWIKNLIRSLFICLFFVRTEREGEWLLHLTAVKSMLPYFYTVGHHN